MPQRIIELLTSKHYEKYKTHLMIVCALAFTDCFFLHQMPKLISSLPVAYQNSTRIYIYAMLAFINIAGYFCVFYRRKLLRIFVFPLASLLLRVAPLHAWKENYRLLSFVTIVVALAVLAAPLGNTHVDHNNVVLNFFVSISFYLSLTLFYLFLTFCDIANRVEDESITSTDIHLPL